MAIGTTTETMTQNLSMTDLHGGDLLGRSEFAVEHGRDAVVDRRDDPSGQLATEIRRVDALAPQVGGAECAADGGIHQGEMRRGADGERGVVAGHPADRGR